MAAHPPLHPDGPLSLALAVVGSSRPPLLLLDESLKIIAASTSFCVAFDIDPDRIVGSFLGEVGTGEWNKPQLHVLLEATAKGNAAIAAYEMDLKGKRAGVRKLVINAQRLKYSDADPVRLLMTIEDVTAAREGEQQKDDLLREKAILIQELQHRVANSLQIIASVILQSARKTTSEETRINLRDAHSRAMSVAALQQQLAASRLGAVELEPYFTQLCKSIAASMIHDPTRLTLTVEVDDSVTDAMYALLSEQRRSTIATLLGLNFFNALHDAGKRVCIAMSHVSWSSPRRSCSCATLLRQPLSLLHPVCQALQRRLVPSRQRPYCRTHPHHRCRQRRQRHPLPLLAPLVSCPTSSVALRRCWWSCSTTTAMLWSPDSWQLW